MSKKKFRKAHLVKGWLHYNEKPINRIWLEERVLSSKFRELLKQKGIYILYKKVDKKYKVFYVGIAGFGRGKNLYGRLKSHAKNKNWKHKWNHFTAFIVPVSTHKKRYLKDIEAILIRTLNPTENIKRPVIMGARAYQNSIKAIIKEQKNLAAKDLEEIKREQKKEVERLKVSHKKKIEKRKEQLKIFGQL